MAGNVVANMTFTTGGKDDPLQGNLTGLGNTVPGQNSGTPEGLAGR